MTVNDELIVQDGRRLIKFTKELEVDKNFDTYSAHLEQFRGFTAFCFNNGTKNLIGTLDAFNLIVFDMKTGKEEGKFKMVFEGSEMIDEYKAPSIKVSATR